MSDTDRTNARITALELVALRGAEGSVAAALAERDDVRPEARATIAKILKVDLRMDPTGVPILALDGKDFSIADGVRAFLARKDSAIFLKATRTAARPSTKPAPDSKETPAARTKRQFAALGIKGRLGSS